MQKENSMLEKPILTLKNKAFWWMIKLFKPSYTMLFYYQAVIMCDFWQKQKGKIVTDKNINVFAELLTGQAFTDAADLQLVRELRSAPQRELPGWETHFDEKYIPQADGTIEGYDIAELKSFIRTELKRERQRLIGEITERFYDNTRATVEEVLLALEENTL